MPYSFKICHLIIKSGKVHLSDKGAGRKLEIFKICFQNIAFGKFLMYIYSVACPDTGIFFTQVKMPPYEKC
jgi:hypothetical protein